MVRNDIESQLDYEKEPESLEEFQYVCELLGLSKNVTVEDFFNIIESYKMKSFDEISEEDFDKMSDRKRIKDVAISKLVGPVFFEIGKSGTIDYIRKVASQNPEEAKVIIEGYLKKYGKDGFKADMQNKLKEEC